MILVSFVTGCSLSHKFSISVFDIKATVDKVGMSSGCSCTHKRPTCILHLMPERILPLDHLSVDRQSFHSGVSTPDSLFRSCNWVPIRTILFVKCPRMLRLWSGWQKSVYKSGTLHCILQLIKPWNLYTNQLDIDLSGSPEVVVRNWESHHGCD